MIFKCPFCGSMEFDNEQSFRAHAHWKHDWKMEGDLSRFEAPSYGLNSNSETYERNALQERKLSDSSDLVGELLGTVSDLALGSLISTFIDDSSSSSDSEWFGGGGESGGAGADSSW